MSGRELVREEVRQGGSEGVRELVRKGEKVEPSEVPTKFG